MRDITAHIGADFKRVRMGVGRPGTKDAVAGHLLSDFAKADDAWLTPMLDECVRSLPLLLDGRDDKYMSEVARHIQPPRNTNNENKASDNGL